MRQKKNIGGGFKEEDTHYANRGGARRKGYKRGGEEPKEKMGQITGCL